MLRIEDLEIFSGKIKRKSFGRRNPVGILEDDPSKVVRNLYPFRDLPEAEAHDRYLKVIGAWREYRTYPGIRVPLFTPYRDYMVVVNLVNGESLDYKEFSKDEPEAPEVMGQFLDSLIDYTSDKYHNGGFYISDQKVEQYMYGVSGDDQDSGVYFVDLDFEIGRVDPDAHYDLEHLLSKVSSIFCEVEAKLRPHKFNSARIKLLELLEEDVKNGRSYYLEKAIKTISKNS